MKRLLLLPLILLALPVFAQSNPGVSTTPTTTGADMIFSGGTYPLTIWREDLSCPGGWCLLESNYWSNTYSTSQAPSSTFTYGIQGSGMPNYGIEIQVNALPPNKLIIPAAPPNNTVISGTIDAMAYVNTFLLPDAQYRFKVLVRDDADPSIVYDGQYVQTKVANDANPTGIVQMEFPLRGGASGISQIMQAKIDTTQLPNTRVRIQWRIIDPSTSTIINTQTRTYDVVN